MSLGAATTIGTEDTQGKSLRLTEGGRHDRDVERGIARLMGFVAATLAVMSFLHLSGILDDGSEPFDPIHAGIAEALIGLVLASGAATLLRRWRHALSVALASTGIAILGFVVGLTFTIRGDAAIDVAYHATVLPLLIVTLATLMRKADS
jgi:hypothetical protein